MIERILNFWKDLDQPGETAPQAMNKTLDQRSRTKPVTTTLVTGTLSDMTTRSRTVLYEQYRALT